MPKCRACGEPFTKQRPLQVACSPVCALNLINARKAKDAKKAAILERARTRARLDALRPRSYWVKQAQVAFNAWVRLRDADRPCISCNRHHDGAYDAGHYLTTGARPELRFHHLNVHKQCVPCNQHQHGNTALYRIGLIRRIGLAEVERLEGPHPPQHWSIDDLKAIRDKFRALAKALRQPRNVGG